MIKVSIIGASGYTARELIDILKDHPKADVRHLVSRSYPGCDIADIHPVFRAVFSKKCEKYNPSSLKKDTDIAFLALPHIAAQSVAAELCSKGIRVVDLSADYRFKDAAIYKRWYAEHRHASYLRYSVYGLPELNRKAIARSRIVANPGCYATAVLLGLIPAVSKGLAEKGVFTAAMSGVSGAGRKLERMYMYTEANENISPYAVLKHRHSPEIAEVISRSTGRKIDLLFVPHLAPMDRGILATSHLRLKKVSSLQEMLKVYRDFYRREPFVRVLDKGVMPQTKNVCGTNFCEIGMEVSGKDLVVFSAIDNLVKGASGQAVQNMNIMAGIPEKTGLI